MLAQHLKDPLFPYVSHLKHTNLEDVVSLMLMKGGGARWVRVVFSLVDGVKDADVGTEGWWGGCVHVGAFVAVIMNLEVSFPVCLLRAGTFDGTSCPPVR